MKAGTAIGIGLTGLAGVLLIRALTKKKKKTGRKGIAMSKKVRKINAKMRKEIPLDQAEKMFVWTFSHPKNNPKGKRYKFISPIVNKPGTNQGSKKRKK